MGGPLGGLILKPTAGFTPIDLGTKLLNWWDGTIVDEDPATEVNSWEDQKGTFDWQNVGATKKPEYDSGNNLIIFDSTNQEFLENNTNVASFNRSTGEYWVVIDYVLGSNQIFLLNISTLGTNNQNFSVSIVTDKVRVAARRISSVFDISTTSLVNGKNIVRVSSIGASYVVNLNGIDITSEFNAGIGAWEDYPSSPNRVSSGGLVRVSNLYSDLRINAFLRTEIITAGEATNMFNYLNAKY